MFVGKRAFRVEVGGDKSTVSYLANVVESLSPVRSMVRIVIEGSKILGVISTLEPMYVLFQVSKIYGRHQSKIGTRRMRNVPLSVNASVYVHVCVSVDLRLDRIVYEVGNGLVGNRSKPVKAFLPSVSVSTVLACSPCLDIAFAFVEFIK